MAIENFTRTKAAIKIYEDLNPEEYDALTKEPHAFYLVNGVGIYKGTTLISAGANSSMDEIVEELNQAIAAKQDTLVSGTNIKTINGESILGEGNIEVAASDDGVDTAYVENEVLYIDDDTSAGNNGLKILEKTLPPLADAFNNITEYFTTEEINDFHTYNQLILNVDNSRIFCSISAYDLDSTQVQFNGTMCGIGFDNVADTIISVHPLLFTTMRYNNNIWLNITPIANS